ncbi:MAG: peptidyl-prolyl cis-trans isomerase [Thermodesulfobacteriota bacterium]|nr:peptidyl-prolyl cis-trans isomerase [Thermodesulfobacteriota bacterium]
MKKLFIFLLLLFFLFPPVSGKRVYADSVNATVIAEVNGEIIDEDDLVDRIKDIHRNKPMMPAEGGASGIDVSEIVEQLVTERLMIQEAYLLKLEQTPDFVKKIENVVRTQSVLQLRQEEVFDKINIAEQAILAYFKEHYEKDGPAPEGKLEKVRRRIERKIRKQKVKELSEDYVVFLREKAEVWIDEDFVDSLDPERDYDGEKPGVARVNGSWVPVDDFLHDLKQGYLKKARMFQMIDDAEKTKNWLKDLKKEVLDRLITFELVEREALGRDYMRDPGFAEAVKKRQDGLLLNEFRGKVVYPLAVPTEEEMKEYYKEHIDDFKGGYEVWIDEMRFKDEEEAEDILDELRQGASFSFLAAEVSGSMRKKGRVWVREEAFSHPVREELHRMKKGDISNVIADGRDYKIIKLKGKRGGEPIPYPKVVNRLDSLVGQEKFRQVLSEYMEKLRDFSTIKVHEKAIKQIEEKYWKEIPKKTETKSSAG